LIEKLKAHKIPAIGFVQGGMISDGEKLFPVRANIVRLWRDAGFEIGIGGFKHIWFNGNSVENYIANTEKNERVVRQILAEKNLPLLYFSYPFLNTGKSAGDRENSNRGSRRAVCRRSNTRLIIKNGCILSLTTRHAATTI
jgi:hypothetical protein